MIYQNSSGMLDLVNDILDIAKLQAGKFEIHTEPGDIAEVINNRIKFFEVSAGDKKIKLTSFISPHIPKVVIFDVNKIKEVLNNLISNALKFTKEKNTISIATFIHDAGASVGGEVKDRKLNLPAPLPEDIFAKALNSLVVMVCASK